MEIFNTTLIAGLIAAVAAFLATPFVIKLAWKTGLIDDPKKYTHAKTIHTKPTPRGGGLAIFVGLAVAAFLFLPHDKHLYAILGGAIIIIATGLLDDKFNLNPYLRLIIQFAAASIPILSGIGITFITNPAGGVINLSPLIADLLSLFWIVFLMNMLNLGAKGVDGQLTGVTIIAAITIAILSLKFSADITQWPVIILAGITAGAFLGFLPWHIYPQKIMPSFSGSNLAGYLLAVLTILSTAKVGTLIVVLAIPIIDTTYVVIRRMISGKSPLWGDRGHLHHRLLDSGKLTKAQVALFYWIITALLGILAINLNTSFKFYTIIAVGFAVGGLILWLTYLRKN